MPRRTTKTSGFTLIELMLVLLILTLVVSGVVTSFRGFSAGRRHKDTAAQLMALARYARTQAISEARIYRINFDGTSAFYLTVDDGGDFVSPGADFGRQFPVPGDVTMTDDIASTSEGRFIAFRPNGMTDPAKIEFVNQAGDSVEVICRTATESFEIASATTGAP